MSGGGLNKREKKQAYLDKLTACLDTYQKVVVVGADNVGSSQLHKIRQSLRGDAELLMGKNTMVRTALREYVKCNPKAEPLLGTVKNNVGFVFTNADLVEIEKKLLQRRGGIIAKAGTVAPNDVIVPKGLTGLDPQQTMFLHALNIPSKIRQGQIEILNDIHLVKAGDKVGPSEATLLQKLNMKPFSYGLSIFNFFDDGQLYEPNNVSRMEDLRTKIGSGINNAAAFALSLGFPTLASLPHVLSDAYKQILAVGVETGYSFPDAEKIKAKLVTIDVGDPPAPDDEVDVVGGDAVEIQDGDGDDDWNLDLFA